MGERLPCADKVRYRNRREAFHAMARDLARRLAPKRAYRCRDCGGWHLTSQPIRDTELPHA